MFEDIEKHQLDSSPYSPHTIIPEYVPPNSIVLDVGCGRGFIAKKLKEKNCRTVGIELDQDSVTEARKYCQEVIVADVETVKVLHYAQNSFDVMIFSDILEHLKRPDSALSNFRQYLKPEGFLIASIPNIARLEHRIKHLLGDFDYEPQGGIVSRTHLRFFTLKTAKQLFAEAGYEIVKIDYTGLGARFRVFPTLLAFQFIIIAKKHE